MASDVWNDDVGATASFVLSACVVSPDGELLAVGTCDRLASVYICKNVHE
ncbi:MAG: hypothetical protein IKU34_05965 [Clostridia bacterium]|nr:hypothetical protein [Clostridia bacterium]